MANALNYCLYLLTDANREKGQTFVKVSAGIDFTIAKQRP